MVPLLALSAPNIGRAAGKVHVTAFKVYYLPCSYYSVKKTTRPVKLRFARGAMAKKPAGAKKISIVILQVIRKGNRTAKYSTFATAAPKL